MTITTYPMLFRGSDAIVTGALTPGRLRGPGFRRLCQDVYAPASLRVTHELRCRAFALSLGDEIVVTGRSAATVRGVRITWPEDDVEVLAPPWRRLTRRTGLEVRRTTITESDWEPWAGSRLASPSRMALDLLLGRELPDAVAYLDAVARAGLVEVRDVAALVAARSDNGIVAARRAAELADPRAESLPESRLRVLLVLDGLDPVPQQWIHDDRGPIARADLVFEKRRVAVEYDGDWRDGELWALNRDRERLNRVHAAGWTVVFVTAQMMRDIPRLLRTIRAALG